MNYEQEKQRKEKSGSAEIIIKSFGELKEIFDCLRPGQVISVTLEDETDV